MFYLVRRRWVRCLASLFTVFQLWFCTSALAEPMVVRVGVFDNAPQVIFLQDGRVQGIFVDVLEAVAQQEGWSIEYVRGSLAEGLARLQGGSIDLMAGVAGAAHRQSTLSFQQEPVLHSWSQVFARRGSGIRNILDLSGKRVALLEGSVQQAIFVQLARDFNVHVTVLPCKDYATSLAAVVSGAADAFVTNPLYGRSRAQPAGLEDTAIVFSPMTMHFASKKNARAALLQAIDRHLQAMKADPTSAYFVSLGRWTRMGDEPRVPPWFKWGASAAALLLALLAGWAFTLRRAAAKLRASEQQQRYLAEELTHIFDQSMDAICVVDSQLRYVRVSRASERLWGYRPEEMEGKSCMDFVPAKHREATMVEIAKVRHGAPTYCLPAQSLRKDGSRGWLLWSGVWSDARQEMYWIARDDAERRQLISRLHARTAELQLANDELHTFSESVAHDLRSPVSTITGFVGKVVRDRREVLGERYLSLLQRSLAAACRMDQLIVDLLSLARISEHGVHRRPCDLSVIARDVAEALRNAQPHRKVRFTVEPGMSVLADPQLLRVALENLLGNSWKFTAHAGEASVVVGREQGEGADVFFVRDNGAGFDMDHAGKLFKPFQRLHTQQEFEGTGIGLSIVHRVVTRHGGRIWAESGPGAGAVFRFTLAAPCVGVVPVGDASDSASSTTGRLLSAR